MFLVGGLGALVLTPVVYRIRTASANAEATAHWLWPTWWMLLPLIVAIVGAVLVFLPAGFDLRRTLLHSRFVTRLRGKP